MKTRKLLLVEDEAVIREMMIQAFSKKGYTVFEAETAEIGLKILETETINVMFLDLNLPGMNGVELCREIKSHKPISIVYAVTGYASLFELDNCREAGFDDYFTKPVSLESLFKAADDAFEKIERWKDRK